MACQSQRRSQEPLANFSPIVDAGKPGLPNIAGRGVEDALPVEPGQLMDVVVNEEVSSQDALVATEDNVGVRDEREMFVQPFVLVGE